MTTHTLPERAALELRFRRLAAEVTGLKAQLSLLSRRERAWRAEVQLWKDEHARLLDEFGEFAQLVMQKLTEGPR